MKKTTKVITSGVLATGIFVSGGLVSANSNWLNDITIKNNAEIDKAATTKTNELINSIEENVQAEIESRVGSNLDETKTEIVTELETHYHAKIDEIVENTEDYDEVLRRIDAKATNTTTYSKGSLDDAFAEYKGICYA